MKRQIIIGRHSTIWGELSKSGRLDESRNYVAISHSELRSFDFLAEDTVWVLSYSRSPDENESIIRVLKSSNACDVVYVTSASTNVVEITQCYEYPKVKRMAHEAAIDICGAKVLSIGLFYQNEAELPCGTTASTSLATLASFMNNPVWNEQKMITNLFYPVTRPFESSIEKVAFFLYGALLSCCGQYPCLLRPIDLILKILKMRWYGYLYLSNKLWYTKIS